MNRTPILLSLAVAAACTSGGSTGPAPVILLANPLTWDYGSVSVSSASAPKDFLVTNAGTTATTLLSSGLGGANAGDFTIIADGCALAFNVAPSGTCTIRVAFTPVTTVGNKHATLDVLAQPGNASVHVTLSGVALP